MQPTPKHLHIAALIASRMVHKVRIGGHEGGIVKRSNGSIEMVKRPATELAGYTHRPLGVDRGSKHPLVIVFPPWPKLGGCMENATVQLVCEIASLSCLAAFRFNYRGVSPSEGFRNVAAANSQTYDERKSKEAGIMADVDRDDAAEVVQEMLKYYGSVILVGFSYGAVIAAAVAEILSPRAVASVVLLSYPFAALSQLVGHQATLYAQQMINLGNSRIMRNKLLICGGGDGIATAAVAAKSSRLSSSAGTKVLSHGASSYLVSLASFNEVEAVRIDLSDNDDEVQMTSNNYVRYGANQPRYGDGFRWTTYGAGPRERVVLEDMITSSSHIGLGDDDTSTLSVGDYRGVRIVAHASCDGACAAIHAASPVPMGPDASRTGEGAPEGGGVKRSRGTSGAAALKHLQPARFVRDRDDGYRLIFVRGAGHYWSEPREAAALCDVLGGWFSTLCGTPYERHDLAFLGNRK